MALGILILIIGAYRTWNRTDTRRAFLVSEIEELRGEDTQKEREERDLHIQNLKYQVEKLELEKQKLQNDIDKQEWGLRYGLSEDPESHR